MVFTSSAAVFAQQTDAKSNSVDYNEENYTTDYSQMVAILKTAFKNRLSSLVKVLSAEEGVTIFS
jgi:hypothetical protein